MSVFVILAPLYERQSTFMITPSHQTRHACCLASEYVTGSATFRVDYWQI